MYYNAAGVLTSHLCRHWNQTSATAASWRSNTVAPKFFSVPHSEQHQGARSDDVTPLLSEVCATLFVLRLKEVYQLSMKGCNILIKWDTDRVQGNGMVPCFNPDQGQRHLFSVGSRTFVLLFSEAWLACLAAFMVKHCTAKTEKTSHPYLLWYHLNNECLAAGTAQLSVLHHNKCRVKK